MVGFTKKQKIEEVASLLFIPPLSLESKLSRDLPREGGEV
jgi:hypothetical protein